MPFSIYSFVPQGSFVAWINVLIKLQHYKPLLPSAAGRRSLNSMIDKEVKSCQIGDIRNINKNGGKIAHFTWKIITSKVLKKLSVSDSHWCMLGVRGMLGETGAKKGICDKLTDRLLVLMCFQECVAGLWIFNRGYCPSALHARLVLSLNL